MIWTVRCLVVESILATWDTTFFHSPFCGSYQIFQEILKTDRIVSEWMSDKRYLDLLPGDVAVRLDLISKVHGLEQAENYFSNIPMTLRGLQVYGALLTCYAHEKSLEKAEAIMQKMRDLGFARTPLSYHLMLKLYSDMGKHEKLDSLMQEMEEKGIKCKDFNAYVVAANGYLRIGVVEKASAMLKKSEQLVRGKKRFAYEVLLTLYASMGDKHEVYRIWNLYKKMGKIYNMGYLSMISSLVKLDDLDGAEKIWEKWEAKKTYFDFQVPDLFINAYCKKIWEEWEAEKTYFDFQVTDLLINAYCKKGLLGNAESIVNRLIESGNELNASIWQCLAGGYQEDDQMEKAVETMKKAILASHSGWKLNLATLAACLEYLKGKESVKVADELIESLKEKGHLPSEVCDRLVNYIENGNPVSRAIDLIMGGDDQGLEGERGM